MAFMQKQFVLAITGASGMPYAARLLQVMLDAGHLVHVVPSRMGKAVWEQELGLRLQPGWEIAFPPEWHVRPLEMFHEAARHEKISCRENTPDQCVMNAECGQGEPPEDSFPTGEMRLWEENNLAAPIASGSYTTDAMVVCPCSCRTLGGIASGAGEGLIFRAAEVHLKERRPLVIVPRETPISLIQIENMKRLARAGAFVLPPQPGFYQRPTTIGDLIDFVVARICDQIGIANNLSPRWGEPAEE